MEDRKRSIETYRWWADRAWREQCSSDPEGCESRAYVAGFKEGFVDYVYGGGSGEPPPVPPRPFWNVEERNPRGHSAATDWFAGYRHGAQVAREEGYRKRALVPSSLFLLDPQEERWRDRPQYAEPLAVPVPVPVADPLPPEFVPPIQDLPLANPNVFEPERSAPTIPAEETPSAVVPNAEVPEVDQDSVREELPSLPAVPEEREPLQLPKPSESPPKDVRPPTDIDDIFGLPTRVFAAKSRRSKRDLRLRRPFEVVVQRTAPPTQTACCNLAHPLLQ